MRFFDPEADPYEMRDDPLRHCPEVVEAIQAQIDLGPQPFLNRTSDSSLARWQPNKPLITTAKAF